MTTNNYKTVAFFGASTGVGLSALKVTLDAGHQCVALCRQPSKLVSLYPPETTPNLKVIEGNAHDIDAVSKCLVAENGNLVDNIIFTIGAVMEMKKLTLDDPNVCDKGMTILVEALAQLRKSGITGLPHIVACSSTGISDFGRDVPLALVPLYYVLLKVPHRDKKKMENRLIESRESFTIIRPTLLVNGETTNEVKVGIEDPKTGRQSRALGYSISREDTGKWVAENLVLQVNNNYMNKLVMMTS